jgi:hypothetical protein
MNLSNYDASVKGSYAFLDSSRNLIYFDGCDDTWNLAYRGLKWRIDGILLPRWIFPSRHRVPISRLEELKRLEVTEGILEEL